MDSLHRQPAQLVQHREVRAKAVRAFPTWPAPRRVRLWRVGGHEVWGVTYRILEPLVPRLLGVNGSCDNQSLAALAVAGVGRGSFMVGMGQGYRHEGE